MSTFDIASATPLQKETYARISAGDRYLVDSGLASIDEFADIVPSDVKEPQSPLEAGGVSSSQPDSYGLGGGAFDAAKRFGQAGLDAASGTIKEAAGQGLSYANEGELGVIGKGLAGNVEQLLNPLEYLANDPEHKQELIDKRAASVLESAQEDKDALQAYKDANDIKEGWESEGVGRTLAGIGLDVAANPDMALTAAAGYFGLAPAVAGIPAGRVYLNKYYELIKQGVPKEEAKARASTEAGIEYIAEQLPGGKLLGAGTKAVTHTGTKIAKGAAEEFVQEGLTELAQGGVDNLISATGIGSEELQASAEANKFADAADALSKASYAAVVGSVAGGTMTAIPGYLQTQAEKNADYAKLGYIQAEHEYRRQLKESIESTAEKTRLAGETKKQADMVTAFQELQAANPDATPEEIAGLFQKKQAEELAASGNTMADALVRGDVPGNVTGVDTREEEARLQADDDAATADKLEQVITAEQMIAIAKANRLKDEEKSTKAATRTWNNNRTKESNRLAEEALDQDLDATHVVSGIAAWETANPRPTRESVSAALATSRKEARDKAAAAAAKAAKTPATKTTTAAAKPVANPADPSDVSPAAVTARMQAEAASRSGVQKSEDATPVTQTPEQVEATGDLSDPAVFEARVKSLTETFRKQGRKMSVRNHNAVSDAVKSGRLVIAKNGAKMPTIKGYEPLDGGAAFDGHTMWVSQESLDDPNNARDLFSSASHEVDHYFRSGVAKAGDTRGLFAGREGVPALVSRIKKLASTGHPVAKRAIAKAELVSNGDADLFNDEATAYWYEYAAQASQKGVLGSARALFNDTVSELKDSALARAFGAELDETKDADHIARKRLSNTDKVQLKAGLPGKVLQSIGGRKATGFNAADFKFEGVHGDGTRFEFSDEDAYLDQMAVADLEDGKKVKLSKLLRHEELYKQYPEAADIEVSIDNSMIGQVVYGSLDGGVRIKINPDYINVSTHLIDTLLHEAQHWIQDQEGFVSGTSPSALVSKAAKRKHEAAVAATKKAFNEFEYGVALKTIPLDVRERWNDQLARRGERHNMKRVPITTAAHWFLEYAYPSRSSNSLVRRQGEKYLQATRDEAVAADELKVAEAEARALYMRDHGEAEARNTELRRTWTDAQRAARRPYESMGDDKAAIRSDNTVDTRKRTKGTAVSPESFRNKGEGEISPQAYDSWADALFGEATLPWTEYTAENGQPTTVNDAAMAMWSRKVTKRYLDKYAGTPEDPLKDVVLPNGETWESLMDASVQPEVGMKRNYHPANPQRGLGAGTDILNYLGHVKDYMQGKVGTLEELNKYDLVRAVKETAEHDKAEAKKALKAKIKKDSNLTPYIDYKDGSRWVRLDKPGQFATESDIMGHSVRGYEPTRYVDSKGKPIANIQLFQHNGEPRRDTVPLYLTPGLGNVSLAQALEAGAIKDNPDWVPEATTMPTSHPEYGHGGWEGIKRGQGEIYSLRDKNGESHATIEIENIKNMKDQRAEFEEKTGKVAIIKTPNGYNRIASPEYEEWLKTNEVVESRKTEVTQIKGKTNDKVSDKYTPYIHDFLISLPGETEVAENSFNWDGGKMTRNWPMGDGSPTRSSKLTLPERASSILKSVDDPQINTFTFKAWFGKSKVVDDNGKPKVVYHGTNGNFDEFSMNKLGAQTGAPSARMGFFFASQPKVAASYAHHWDMYKDEGFAKFLNKMTFGLYEGFNEGMNKIAKVLGTDMPPTRIMGGNVMPVYLSIENPLVVDFYGLEYRDDSYASIIRKAKALDHDGVIFKNTFDPGFHASGEVETDVYVAFKPNQIKSAISNNGNFSKTDNNIRRSVDDPVRRPLADIEADVTKTANFKRWFKDSVVAYGDGEPKMMYHGTRAGVNFEEFKENPGRDLGMHFGTKAQANNSRFVDELEDYMQPHKPSRIMPVYLSIQNPVRLPDVFGSMGIGAWEALERTDFVTQAELDSLTPFLATDEKFGQHDKFNSRFKEILVAHGFDGVVYNNRGEPETGETWDGTATFADSFIAFYPTQIKSALGNNGDFSPTNPSYLKSEDDVRTKAPPSHYGIDKNYRAIRHMLNLSGSVVSTKGGIGEVAQEILEHGKSLPTSWQYEAKVRHNRLNREIEKARELDPNFDWQGTQEKVEAEESPEIRERILEAVGRVHPEVVREYRGFRDAMDDLSTEIVLQRLAYVDQKPLTEQEAAIYDAIMRNRGRYVTRNYLATFGARGEDFADRTLHGYNRVNKLRDMGIPETQAQESELRSYARFANAVTFLQERLTIPEELPDNMQQLRELYSMWASPTGGETKEFLQARLDSIRERVAGHEGKLKAQAELIAKEILGLTGSSAASYASVMRGLSQDNTIVTARSSVPHAIRELLGEVKDPAVKMMLTLAAQANLMARTKMLFELQDTPGVAIHAGDRATPGNEKYTEELGGSAYGPMEGMYVTPEMAVRLKNTLIPMLGYDQALLLLATQPDQGANAILTKLFKGWVGIATLQKTLQVVWNFANAGWNYLGAYANIATKGHVSHIADAHRVALELINSRNSTTLSEDAKEVLAMGVTDSAQMGELQAEQFAVLEDLAYGETLDTAFDKANRKRKNYQATATETYAMTDVWGKIANYMHQRDKLREFHRLNGDNFSEEKIKRLAADKVSNDNVTYKRAMPLAKAAERVGIVWFATFTAEVVRSQAHNLAMIAKEVAQANAANTPEARKHMLEMATLRALGTSAVYAALVFGLTAFTAWGDDEEDKAAKKLLPDWVRHGAPLFIGTDDEGHPMYIALSRVDPFGPVLDIVRAGVSGDPITMTTALEQLKSVYIEPRLLGQTVKLFEKIKDPTATWADVRKVGGEIANSSMVPSGVRNAATPNVPVVGGKTDYPKGAEGKLALGGLLKLFGAALIQGDPQKAGWPMAQKWNDTQKRGRKELYQMLDDEEVDSAKFAELLLEQRHAEREAFRELVEFDKALTLTGMRPVDRANMLEEMGIENKAVVAGIMKGRNLDDATTLLSSSSFKMQLSNAASKLPASKQEAYKERVKANARKLQSELGFGFTK